MANPLLQAANAETTITNVDDDEGLIRWRNWMMINVEFSWFAHQLSVFNFQKRVRNSHHADRQPIEKMMFGTSTSG